jgi:hypothetical protein
MQVTTRGLHTSTGSRFPCSLSRLRRPKFGRYCMRMKLRMHWSINSACLPALYRYRPAPLCFCLPGAWLSMVVSRPLLNASRGTALNCSTSSFRNIWKAAYRANTRSYYIATPRAFVSTRIPLLLPLVPSSNSPIPHQQQKRAPLRPLRPQTRHCSHRRTMCRHQHEADTPGSSFDITQGREILPANVKPIHYHLTLEPNLETFEYKGTVVIE